MNRTMNRRDFLKAAAMTTAAAISAKGWSADGNAARLPRRRFGRHEEMLSIVGFAGVAIKGIKDQQRVNRAVARAYEMGCNYFDVAPKYGNAQNVMGPALAPYRKNVFLSCKTAERTADGARAELKKSLELLKTDHFDLYQLHHVRDVAKEVDVLFGKGGAMEVLQEAKKQGQVKYLGFSAHTVEAALELMKRFDFDSIMFPINFASFYKGNFGPEVVKLADQKQMAKIAIKPLCRQDWPRRSDTTGGGRWTKMWYQPITDPREAELALKWAYTQGITTAMPPGEEELQFFAIETALKLNAPMTDDELKQLKELAMTLNPTFRAGKITIGSWNDGLGVA